MIRLIFMLAFFAMSQSAIAATYLIPAHGNKCKHGLHHQPNGGPLAVFLFCDDALGSNIGIIHAAKGSGPGKIKVPPDREWKWWIDNRFWQESAWGQDIKNFAWSPDLSFLYVATSHIYGSGGFYRLDLVGRESVRLIPSAITPYFSESKYTYETEILAIDLKKAELLVKFDFHNPVTGSGEVRKISIKMNRLLS